MKRRSILFLLALLITAACSNGSDEAPALARPKFTFARGVNLVKGTPPFALGADVSYLAKLGFDHACVVMQIEGGPAEFPALIDLIHRLNAAGLGAIMRPFYDGTDKTAYSTWWAEFLKALSASPNDPAGISLDLANEPHQWDVQTTPTSTNAEVWRSTLQPALYAQVRKDAPKNRIILSPGMYASWQTFQYYIDQGGPDLWLPKDDSNIAVDFHPYVLQKDGSDVGVDPAVLAQVTVWAARRGVALQATEFDGGEGATPWARCVQGISDRAQILGGASIGWALWHITALLDDSGTVRPDVLAAVMKWSYKPPLTGAHISVGPAGSGPVGFGAVTPASKPEATKP